MLVELEIIDFKKHYFVHGLMIKQRPNIVQTNSHPATYFLVILLLFHKNY